MANIPTANNNPGDIKDPATGAFRTFADPNAGFTALKNDLTAKMTGNTSTGLHAGSSLLDFSNVWAPASDRNNPTQYAQNLATQLGVPVNTPIGSLQSRIDDFAHAIAKNEGFGAQTAYAAEKPNAGGQMNVADFAASVKKKYPQYANVDDNVLTQKILAKYPQYQSKVAFTPPAPVQTPNQQAEQTSASATGAFFPAAANDSPLVAPLKTLGNLGSSAVNFGKAAVGLLNPMNAVSNLGNAASQVPDLVKEAGSPGLALKYFMDSLPGAAYHTLMPEGAQGAIQAGYGAFQDPSSIVTGKANPNLDQGLQRAQMAVENDPVGNILPFLAAAKGIAPEATDAVTSKIASPVTKTTAAVASKAGDIAGNTAEYLTEKATGFNPSTVKAISENPDSFTPEAMASVNRRSLGEEVAAALSERQKAVSDTGSEYQSIRDLQQKDTAPVTDTTKAIKEGGRNVVYNLVDAPNEKLSVPELRAKVQLLGKEANAPKDIVQEAQDALKQREVAETIPHQVKVNPNYLEKTLRETTGIGVKDGKLETTGSAAIRDAKDVRALQHVYDLWKPVFAKGKLTTTEYLNFRGDLAKMAKFEREVSKSQPLEDLAGVMRGKLNSAYRDRIPGLQALDEKFAPQISDFKRLSKGFVKGGELTDAAINRIANATGKGKDLLLDRLEEIKPGITKKIQILKAVEDIQNIHKVGTYTKTTLEGGGLVGGIVTGNLPLVAGSIAMLLLSQPEVAVRIIRAYGSQAKPLAAEVLKKLKATGSTVNNLPDVKKSVFGRDVKNFPIKAGLSIEDVSKNVPKDEGGVPKNATEMTVEQATEAKDGWQPGMREQFDRALMNKDQSAISKMLPDVPAAYKEKFSNEIAKILGKTNFGKADPLQPLAEEAKKFKSADEFAAWIRNKSEAGMVHEEFDNYDWELKSVPLKDIPGDMAFESHLSKSQFEKHVNTMAADIKKGDALPPIMLDGDYIVNGNHRLEAYMRAGYDHIPALVAKGKGTGRIDLADFYDKAASKSTFGK